MVEQQASWPLSPMTTSDRITLLVLFPLGVLAPAVQYRYTPLQHINKVDQAFRASLCPIPRPA